LKEEEETVQKHPPPAEDELPAEEQGRLENASVEEEDQGEEENHPKSLTRPVITITYGTAMAYAPNCGGWREMIARQLGFERFKWRTAQGCPTWREGRFSAVIYLGVYIPGREHWVETDGQNIKTDIRRDLNLPKRGWSLWKNDKKVEEKFWKIDHYVWRSDDESLKVTIDETRISPEKMVELEKRLKKEYPGEEIVMISTMGRSVNFKHIQREGTYWTVSKDDAVQKSINSHKLQDIETGEMLIWRALKRGRKYQVEGQRAAPIKVLTAKSEWQITFGFEGDLGAQWNALARKMEMGAPFGLFRKGLRVEFQEIRVRDETEIGPLWDRTITIQSETESRETHFESSRVEQLGAKVHSFVKGAVLYQNNRRIKWDQTEDGWVYQVMNPIEGQVIIL
jgi:hypothetical protein